MHKQQGVLIMGFIRLHGIHLLGGPVYNNTACLRWSTSICLAAGDWATQRGRPLEADRCTLGALGGVVCIWSPTTWMVFVSVSGGRTGGEAGLDWVCFCFLRDLEQSLVFSWVLRKRLQRAQGVADVEGTLSLIGMIKAPQRRRSSRRLHRLLRYKYQGWSPPSLSGSWTQEMLDCFPLFDLIYVYFMY